MSKFYTLYTVLALTLLLLAYTSAEPLRRQQQRQRNGRLFLARQEQAPEAAPPAAAEPDNSNAAAPYPAAGFTPDTPFELPTETEAPAPDQTYGPPDQTYGPPDQTYGPPAEEAAVETPDNTYGPPADAAAAEEVPADAEQNPDLVSQNLIQPRNKPLDRLRGTPARLRFVQPAQNQKGFNVIEVIRSEPVLVYSLQ